MKYIFISDSHLSGIDDINQHNMVKLVDSLSNSDTLVFIGDIFEVWYGFNDVIYYEYIPILAALLNAVNRGVKIIYCEGNHDFHMGSFFQDVLKADIYSESGTLLIHDYKIFIAHGDTIDVSEIGRRVLRAVLRHTIGRFLIKLASPKIIKRIQQYLSIRSKDGSAKNDRLRQLLSDFARIKWDEGYSGVILGHSHLSEMIRDEMKGDNKIYINIGTWKDSNTYLKYESGSFSFETFHFDRK